MDAATQHTGEWIHVQATETVPAHLRFLRTIDKPELDTREYRMLRLGNGLLTVLIHDDHADKAAACLSIAVGHMQDPVCI
jgi:insulysin